MALQAGVLVPWREAWLHPRAAQRRALREATFLTLLPLPLAAGVVQSWSQAANSNLGARGVSLEWLLVAGIVIGSIWGLLALYVVSGVLYLGARSPEGRVPFRDLRTVVALSHAPLATAFVFWVTATLTLGPDMYVDFTVIPSSLGPIELMEVGLLYLATALCGLWSMVVLVVGLAEVQRSSVWRAVATLAKSILLLVLAGLLVAFVAVALQAV